MAQEKITSIFDIPAIKKEQRQIFAMLKQTKKALNDLNKAIKKRPKK